LSRSLLDNRHFATHQVKADGHPTRKWCKRRGLEEQRFYDMMKLKRQFKDLLQVSTLNIYNLLS